MGPDLKLTEKSEATSKVVSTNTRKGSEAQNQENKGMQGNGDIEIDFAECMNSGDSVMIDVECQDATECSSSFDDTVSGDENGLLVNDEVESPLCEPKLSGSLFDGRNGLFQMGTRRLTDHWRRFIHPLVWRCKWLEVKLHEFKSQALKYERELAEYDQNKQFEFEKDTFEGFDATSQAFHSKIQRKEVMKRKKRKRVEDTAEVASYMSHHNIFSYYERKKSVASTASALDDDWGDLDNKAVNGCDDIGCNDGWPFQSSDGDNLTEQILQKIEVLHSRIHILKKRMDKVVNESPQKFLSINKLSSVVPSGVLNNSGNHRYAENGDRNSLQCTTSQHASECDMWDHFMPESAVSNHGEVAPFPDMIRSMSQRLLEISSENIEGEILIPNQAAKEELRDFGSAIIQQAEKPHTSMEKLKTISLIHSPGDNSPVNTTLQPNAHSPFSKSKQTDNKRTRGEQKSSLGMWSRRSSG
ncbi:uncharacterized protein LOC111277751 [Durio zibethinus]|uniref:Uncharacterized protein LOC111277751 n=1 Tax=Durio zibethinus TaxID=66656 RepID=A0A6P5WUS6_DURZI|nr:uncharacterized protein LOC111277751 [Durio zibethinus]XP_022719900.1 uncharacterized protein LOC111277751 [Durio zibethinus]